MTTYTTPLAQAQANLYTTADELSRALQRWPQDGFPSDMLKRMNAALWAVKSEMDAEYERQHKAGTVPLGAPQDTAQTRRDSVPATNGKQTCEWHDEGSPCRLPRDHEGDHAFGCADASSATEDEGEVDRAASDRDFIIEACAKVCDQEARDDEERASQYGNGSTEQIELVHMAEADRVCARLIRALKTKPPTPPPMETAAVEELERLEKAATPGPCRFNAEKRPCDGYDDWTYSVHAPDGTELISDAGFSYEGLAVETPRADAELIVAMRNALPGLLTRIRATTQEQATPALDHILAQLDQPDSTQVWSREDVEQARAELTRLRSTTTGTKEDDNGNV